MIEWWWSYTLLYYPLATMYLAGRKVSSTWMIGLWGVVAWNIYGWITDQSGFIVTNFIFMGIYLKNWKTWKNDTTRKGG